MHWPAGRNAPSCNDRCWRLAIEEVHCGLRPDAPYEPLGPKKRPLEDYCAVLYMPTGFSYADASLQGECCRSSVVERILGKAEVGSSILPGSTISAVLMTQNPPKTPASPGKANPAREARLAKALRANLKRRKAARLNPGKDTLRKPAGAEN